METKNYKDTLLRGIALLGLILILVLGAWGIIVLAFNATNILSSAGTTIAGIFGGGERESVREEEETVNVPIVSPTKPSTPTTPAKPSTTEPKPTYVYTPASQPVVQFYGYADLAVRILSVVPQGGRYAMQFEVANVGSNIAGAGWMFTAKLPTDTEYTFTSGPQQALRPGDKIVYTLGFDAPRYGYGYEYDNWNDYNDSDDERYEECDENHNSWDAEEWFDWYQDTWDTSSDTREDWDADEWEDWYDEFCDDRDNDNDNDDEHYFYGDNSGVVSVTVNPYGSLYESNRFNNSASQSINFNYYPTYPTYPSYPQYPQNPYPWAY